MVVLVCIIFSHSYPQRIKQAWSGVTVIVRMSGVGVFVTTKYLTSYEIPSSKSQKKTGVPLYFLLKFTNPVSLYFVGRTFEDVIILVPKLVKEGEDHDHVKIGQ